MRYYVYLIRNLINCKIYVGYTKRKKKRWTEHKYRTNDHLKNALLKYGKEKFEFIIVQVFTSKKKALIAEQFLIYLYASWDNKFGYNQTFGGENNYKTDRSINKQKITFIKNRDLGLCKNVKFTKTLISSIKDQVIEGDKSWAQIARDFGVNATHVARIAKNKIWTDVLKNTPIINSSPENYSHKGEKNGNAKLTNSLVIEIRQQFLIVKNIAEMARRYKISETQMSRIIKRECFKHVS